MNVEKQDFIEEKFVLLLNDLSAPAVGKWGKMNGQQMVEHVSDFFKISTGKLKFPLVTPVEQLPKYREFLYSDKEFRENTKAPVLPEEALPIRFANIKESISDLNNEIKSFKDKFTADKTLVITHPVFGELNYEEWVLLHYKHVTHHLKQFGLFGNLDGIKNIIPYK